MKKLLKNLDKAFENRIRLGIMSALIVNEYLDFTLDYRDEETIHDDTLVYVDYGIPLDECNGVDMDTWQATFGASLRHHNDIMARNG